MLGTHKDYHNVANLQVEESDCWDMGSKMNLVVAVENHSSKVDISVDYAKDVTTMMKTTMVMVLVLALCLWVTYPIFWLCRKEIQALLTLFPSFSYCG